MDKQEYEGLIRRLEAQAENDPKRFRTQVFLISNCAYLVLALAFVICFALLFFAYNWQKNGHSSVALIGISLSVLPAFWITLKAFFFRLSPPSGYVLTPKNAPTLFDILNKMRKKLNGPPFHHVVVDHTFNAAISQVPRWGLFGGYKNHLILGLPYLFGVTPQEMLATIAHEYGHVAGNHGKLGAWVYRQRITFGELSSHLEKSKDEGLIEAAIYAAISKFAPYFNAYTFVLSRQNEYEADQTATELIGAKINATGLIRDHLLGSWFYKSFWPTIYKQADTHPEPIFKPYSNMKKIFSANYDVWATPQRLQAEWRLESDLLDTHPCLSDRVMATGEKSSLPPQVNISAAEKILGNLALEIAKKLDEEWWAHEKTEWQDYHRRSKKDRETIRKLSLNNGNDLSISDLHELALLSAKYESAETAKTWLALVLSKSTGNFSKAEFEYGKLLLNEKNAKGVDHLEKAALADKTLFEESTSLAYHFLLENQGEIAANRWWERVSSHLQ